MPVIIKRSEARAQGLNRYFTGKPCPQGHVVERIVSSGACTICAKARNAKWAADNRDHVTATKAEWRKRNPDKVKATSQRWQAKNAAAHAEMQRGYRDRNIEKEMARQAKWLAENKDKMKAINAKWYQENRHKVTARDARRRASVENAQAKWDEELTQFVTQEATDLAKAREACTGFEWQVDHMIPLRAKNACGLHTWSNLQVIPRTLNHSKWNRMWLTEPFEWLRHA